MKSIIVFVLFATFVFGQKFPHYMQCDPQWGNTTMGVPGHPGEDDTICNQGCAMSSLSMAMAGYGITINGQTATPATLNAWLQANNGYVCLDGDCCNLVLDAVASLAPNNIRSLGEPLTPFLHTLQNFVVMDNLVVLAHVRDQHHFVLVTDVDPKDPNSFLVLDPFYNSTSYSYSDIHDILLYDMIPAF